jgi:RNA-directed DNA polymerase
MKRTRIELAQIADMHNLTQAAWRAAQGKRKRPEAVDFLASLYDRLDELRAEIVHERVVLEPPHVFRIRDPKPRVIHAPRFRERVLHHALMACVGPVLERSLIDDTFACRCGKGTVAAVHRAQQHVRRFDWYVKMDVRQYFASIDHDILKQLLRRRVQGAAVLRLISQLIDAHADQPECGLPIGALTSQHFANFYLNGIDRAVLSDSACRGYVRYMDDFIAWCDTRQQASRLASLATDFVGAHLSLELRDPIQINRSTHGVTFCGFRIHAGTIQLARSRRQRFLAGLDRWEKRYEKGLVSADKLQSAADALLGMTTPADAQGWLAAQMCRRSVGTEFSDW